MPRSHTAVVFDMDGLMLDTERIALECWIESARQAGWEITRETCLAMVGLDQRASQKVLLERYDASFPRADISKAARVQYLERLRGEGIGLKPGLLEMLDWLSEAGVPIAVATSTRIELALEKLTLAGIRDRFVTIVGGDQVAQGKPAPDVYRAAVEAIAMEPARCIALEDSDVGLRAAHAAGLACIVVPDLRPPSPEFEPLAHAVVPSLREAQLLVAALLGLR